MTINNTTKISLLSLVVGCLSLVGVAFATDVPGVTNNIASANIDRHAWNDVVGWVDFGSDASATTGEVEVTDAQLKGYAKILQAGFLALDCATSPNGDICATSSFKVSNDGSGNLSGWGWNDNIGWISFDSASAGALVSYQVKIDGSTGDFSGWAWNDVVGWISFNCHNNEGVTCTDPISGAPNDYKVNTSWRIGPNPPFPDPPTGPTGIGPGSGGGGGGTGFDADTYLTSSVFDTQVKGGAALNTVMWLGNQPAGTEVGIQIASSGSSSGPWTFIGPDGTAYSAYQMNQGVQFKLKPNDHNNKRYFRYKVYLKWVAGATPEVQDVIINYSP